MDRLSAEKIIYHADRLLDIKERKDTYPVHMAIGLTDYCNHKCIFCNSEFATAASTREGYAKSGWMNVLKDADAIY